MTAPVAAVSVFCPTPAIWSFAPKPALAVASSRPPTRSAGPAPDMVSVMVLPVVSAVRTVVHQTEMVLPSVALALDCENSPAFDHVLPEVSATETWSVVAPSVALIDCDEKHAIASCPAAIVPVGVRAIVPSAVARLVSPRIVRPEKAIAS